MNRISLLGLVSLAAFAEISSAELCTPDQWQGFISWKGLTLSPDPYEDEIKTFMFSDAKSLKRASFVSFKHYGQERNNFFHVTFFTKSGIGMVTYDVNLETNECEKWVDTQARFLKQCIPASAYNLGSRILGIAGQGGISVTSYQILDFPKQTMLTVTKVGNNIIPVHKASFDENNEALSAIVNYNYTIGIQDPAIFEIPKQCNQGVVEHPADTPLPKKLLQRLSFFKLF